VESLRELYRIGPGPSSSHTMGPQRAALRFREQHPDAARYRVTLYGSLAATGRGHLTDVALERVLHPLEIDWQPGTVLRFHPNGMDFAAYDGAGRTCGAWRVFSVGGGALREENAPAPGSLYPLSTMAAMLTWCEAQREPLWRIAELYEGPGLWVFLADTWNAMQSAICRGLAADGQLPGALRLHRKAREMFARARRSPERQRTGLVSAYALAVMEENGAAGVVVTAPTCGACGVVPAVLRFMRDTLQRSDREIVRALATAGLVGNLVKTNASISGAEVGCQGEVGTACAMAAAAAAQLLGGTPPQVEYAAEIGMEHHLGLTCDPILGLVQIPCIERNAFAATRAVAAAEYALLSDGAHRVSLDEIVRTMHETGRALPNAYRETSRGGLAQIWKAASHPM
jgi:L-serine dehydratase